nr:reverse transcriptase domain-containing protein [Tanacetum cinerariifolium]
MPDDPYAYVVAAFQALPLPDYVPGLEEPEQAPPSPVYIPYVPEPEYPEYIPLEDEVFPTEEQPLPAAASPTTNSPGYVLEFDPDEDPKDDDDDKDPVNYPADHDDEEEEEEPSGDDVDEEDKEQDEDDNDEEEEHPASADSIPPPPALLPSPPLPASPPTLPIPLSAASPPLQLLSSDRRADRPEVTLPPRKRLSIVHCPGYEARESSVAAVARPIEEDIGYGIRDTWIDPRDVAEEEALTTLDGVNTRGRQTEIFQRVEALVDDSQYHYETGQLVDQEAIVSREAWAHSIGLSSAIHFELQGYMTHTWGHLATALGEIRALQAREQARAGAPEGAGTNPDANTVTGTFLLNNCYASVLFDTGADRSFVSTAFSSQFDIAPTVLDHDYAVEL